MTKHTPEPWAITENASYPNRPFILYDPITNSCIATIDWIKSDNETISNANRIVQCVNACAGIANPEALPEVLAFLRDLKENDFHYGCEAAELLAKLEATNETL